MPPRKRKKPTGRSHMARLAHLRGGAGPMGGTRRQQAKRRRRRNKLEEQQAQRDESQEES
jgi:hypothetical protein